MGMLVDNAIVVTDNAQIAIARGIDRRKALINGATGPQWGLLGATFIAICSFLPLYLAPSSVAEIVKPLFIVLAISLGLSWILALTQTTTFGNFILKAKTTTGTTILGMLPLLFDAMFGGMAATIMGGLLVASALTLFVLPVAYCAIHRIKGDLPAQNGMTDNENK